MPAKKATKTTKKAPAKLEPSKHVSKSKPDVKEVKPKSVPDIADVNVMPSVLPFQTPPSPTPPAPVNTFKTPVLSTPEIVQPVEPPTQTPIQTEEAPAPPPVVKESVSQLSDPIPEPTAPEAPKTEMQSEPVAPQAPMPLQDSPEPTVAVGSSGASGEPPVSESPQDIFVDQGESNGSGLKKLLIALGVLVFLMLIGTAVWWFMFRGEEASIAQEKSQTVTSASPTPVETAEIEPSEWTLEVLNGSEVNGAAGSASEKLEEEGYKVGNIGNAESKDYTDTEIWISEDREDESDAILEALTELFPSASLAGTLEEEGIDVRIILGSKDA